MIRYKVERLLGSLSSLLAQNEAAMSYFVINGVVVWIQTNKKTELADAFAAAGGRDRN